jgi:hypothetical protein
VFAASEAGMGENVGSTVAVNITGCHMNSAAELGGVSEEFGENGPVGAAIDLYVRLAPDAGARDDVGPTIPVDITCRDMDSVGEAPGVCEESMEHGSAGTANDFHVGPPYIQTRRARDLVSPAVSVDVGVSRQIILKMAKITDASRLEHAHPLIKKSGLKMDLVLGRGYDQRARDTVLHAALQSLQMSAVILAEFMGWSKARWRQRQASQSEQAELDYSTGPAWTVDDPGYVEARQERGRKRDITAR